jgi:predicted DCC family thiol-disulfide oxidoreductase YuxK
MTFKDLPVAKKIILFDGICNLCNSSVQFVIKRDKQELYRFVPLQSDLGKDILYQLNVNDTSIDSIVLYEPQETFYLKSEAALRILIGFGGIYKLARAFLVFPKGFNDIIYNFIAKNRYRWFGKRASCMVPTPELANKFLS